MPVQSTLELTRTQDVEPLYKNYEVVVNRIKAQAASYKAPTDRLSDVADGFDRLTANEIESNLRARVVSSETGPHDPFSEIRVGLTWMTVPPQAIRINEIRYNDDISGLRTDSNALVKTGRGQVRIDLNLEFPNLDSINSELRTIIAQFRASPFLPLESHYIYNAVMAAAAAVDVKMLDDARLKINRLYDLYKDIHGKMLEAISSNPILMAVARIKHGVNDAQVIEKYRSYLPYDLFQEATDLVSRPEDGRNDDSVLKRPDRRTRILQPTERALGKSYVNLWNLENLMKEAYRIIDEIKNLHSELMQTGLSEASRRPVVPVVFNTMEIMAGQGERDCLKVRMSVLYFAHGPYVPEFAYKDVQGGPTLDIGQCPYFEKYINTRFLNARGNGENEQTFDKAQRFLGKVSSKGAKQWKFKYPIPRLEEVSENEPASSDLVPRIREDKVYGGKSFLMAGKNIKTQKMVRPKTADLLIKDNDPNIMPAECVITIQNKIALQPIHGGLYGTAQHMGAINSKVSVAFDITADNKSDHDLGVASIQKMKLESERVGLMGGPKVRRNTRIRAWNDLLALAGIRYVQIDGVTTKNNPGQLYSSTVLLHMTEYTASQDKREALRRAQPSVGSRAALKEGSLKLAVKLAEDYNRGDNATQRGRLANESDAGLYCHNVLYGSGKPRDPGIISERVVTHVLMNDQHVRAMVREYLKQKARQRVKDDPGYLGTGRLSKVARSTTYALRAGIPLVDSTSRVGRTAGIIGRNIRTELDAQLDARYSLEVTCKKLAREAIEFWRQSKVNLSVFGKTVQIVPQVKLSKITGNVQLFTTPASMLEPILEAITKIREFSLENGWLEQFADYAVENWEEVRQYVKGRIEDNRGKSMYPDLDLPTYSEIFIGNAAVVSQMLGFTSAEMDTKLLRIFTDKYVGPKTKKVLRRFVPTYRDLGKRAPLNKDPFDLAKSFSDFVDPDFYFFHQRTSHLYDSFEEEVQDECQRLYQPSTNYYDQSIGKSKAIKKDLADASREQEVRSRSNEHANMYLDEAENKMDNLDLVPHPNGSYAKWSFKNGIWSATQPKPGYGTEEHHRYAPGDPKMQELLGKFVHDDPRHLTSLFRETIASQKDDALRMIRAFPTFRFYFIELDNENWGYWDDLYSYNAVASIQMSEHKFEPDLLEIKIINTNGHLDQVRSHMEDPDKYGANASWKKTDTEFRDPRPPIGGDETERGTGEPRELDKFYVQVGTNVQLRLGYGSGEEDLEIKFNGIVVAVQPGDIITLTCQSYKNELSVPLNTYLDGSDADPLDVVKWVMDESPTMHFGSWSPYEVGLINGKARDGSVYNPQSTERLGWQGYRQGPKGNSESDQKARDAYSGVTNYATDTVGDVANFVDPTPGNIVSENSLVSDIGAGSAWVADAIASKFGSIADSLVSYTTNRKMSNVYLPRHSTLREALAWKREFLIPDKSGLEVLHEVTRHMPGYVCDVRPYDHNATLFFGKPEQRYFYTATKFDEEKLWQEHQDKKTKESKAVDLAFVNLMTQFESSPFGTVARVTAKARHSSGRERSKAYARYAGGLPGKVLGMVSLGYMGKDWEAAGRRVGEDNLFGYYESPDRTAELTYIEKHLGTTMLKALSVYFFDRYTGKYGSGWTTAAAGVKSVRAFASFALNMATKDYVDAGAAATDLYAALTKAHTIGALPGSMLAKLPGWRDKVGDISVKNDGTKKFNNDLRYQTFDMSTDVRTWNAKHDNNAGVVDFQGKQIPRDKYETSVNAIIDYIPSWKDFLNFFKIFIQLKIIEGDTSVLEAAYNAGRLSERFEHNPRTKRFRDHHYVSAVKDIIANKIVATKEQMANTVVVKYPDDIDYGEGGGRYFMANNIDWQTMEVMVDKNILPSEKKVRLVTEINAEETEKARQCVWSNLAEALRPMYRGELILRGNPRIKPHDIIWINDPYENIFGPIEVERVLTNFSSETGYTTTVIPQLLAIPQSRSQWMDSMVCGQFNALGSLAKMVGTGLGAGIATGLAAKSLMPGVIRNVPFVGTGMALAAGLIGGGAGVIGQGIYQSWKLNEESGAGIWGNMMGRGTYGRQQIPIDIIPLIRNNVPWTAGLRGFGDGNWQLRMFKKIANFKRGLSILSEAAEDQVGL